MNFRSIILGFIGTALASAESIPSTESMLEKLRGLYDQQKVWLIQRAKEPTSGPTSDLVGFPMGDLKTRSGAMYYECLFLGIAGNVLRFKHRDGAEEFPRSSLPPELPVVLSEAMGQLAGRRRLLQDAAAADARSIASNEKQKTVEYQQILAELERRRPENGRIFLKTSDVGTGELQIDNGTQYDAVMNLVSPGTGRRFLTVYVRAGKKTSVQRIRANSYAAIFALGNGFNDTTGLFESFASAGRFENTLRFERVEDQARGQRNVWSLTLHPVPRGEAQIISMTLEEYLALVK
jgi:hypothetical protein